MDHGRTQLQSSMTGLQDKATQTVDGTQSLYREVSRLQECVKVSASHICMHALQATEGFKDEAAAGANNLRKGVSSAEAYLRDGAETAADRAQDAASTVSGHSRLGVYMPLIAS